MDNQDAIKLAQENAVIQENLQNRQFLLRARQDALSTVSNTKFVDGKRERVSATEMIAEAELVYSWLTKDIPKQF